jgi:hypothetical protein
MANEAKEHRMTNNVLIKKLKDIYGSLSAIQGKKILVIHELETALMLAAMNTVVYVTDDESAVNRFKILTKTGFGDDDKTILIGKDTMVDGTVITWSNLKIALGQL